MIWDDAFDDPALLESDRYIRRDGPAHPDAPKRPAWSVRDGVLRLETGEVAGSKLCTLAQGGERWTLHARIRFPEGERLSGGVAFCDDFRYAGGLYAGLYRDEKHCGFQTLGKGLESWTDMPVEAGRWYEVRVLRRGSRFLVKLDGVAVFERTIERARSERPAYDDEPLLHGAFALASGPLEHDRAIEWDEIRIDGDPAPSPKILRRKRFDLGGAPLEMNVLHRKGSEAWAASILEAAPPWLERMEALVGTGPCARVLTWNEQRGTYYENRGGWNEWGQVLEGTSITGAGGHEECHFWQHLYGAWWLNEGMADFYPVLLRASERKTRLRAESLFQDLRPHLESRHEALRRPMDADEAGGPDARPTESGDVPLRMRLGGLKARLFWHVLHRVCGAKALRAMHARAARERLRLSSADARRVLEAETGKDLGPVFAGWVVPGEGRFDIFAAARDQDGDGLSDLDEALAGSDPSKADTDGDGLADGFEFDHGLDPADAGDRARRAAPVAADGLPGDWKGWPALRLDDAGDAGGGPDLRSLRARPLEGGAVLALALGLEAPPQGKWYVQVDLDRGGEGMWTHRVILWPSLGIQDVRVEGRSIDADVLDWGAIGKVVEVALPMSLLGAPERATLAVRVGLDAGPFDAFEGSMATVRLKGGEGDPVAVDGDRSEWDAAAPLADDPAGDAPADLRRVHARLLPDGAPLYLAFTWDGDLPADATLQVDLDGGADGSFERRILLSPRRRDVQVWRLDGGGFAGDGGIISAVGKGGAEMAIPLAPLGLAGARRIAANVMLHGGGGRDEVAGLALIEAGK